MLLLVEQYFDQTRPWLALVSSFINLPIWG
jgi:hypothetical protein